MANHRVTPCSEECVCTHEVVDDGYSSAEGCLGVAVVCCNDLEGCDRLPLTPTEVHMRFQRRHQGDAWCARHDPRLEELLGGVMLLLAARVRQVRP